MNYSLHLDHIHRDESAGPSGNEVDTIIDDLYEKRATTREKALTRLIMHLSGDWLQDELSDKHETLFKYVHKVSNHLIGTSSLYSKECGKWSIFFSST